MMITSDRVDEFLDALVQQDNANTIEWGGEAHDRGHTRADWLAILDLQLAKLRHELHFSDSDEMWTEMFDERMVKIAAVCVAAFGRTRQ